MDPEARRLSTVGLCYLPCLLFPVGVAAWFLGLARSLPVPDAAWLAWNDGLVVRMANAIYDDRLLPSGELDPARLGVLTDAGCTDAELLEHLRGEGPHLRG